MPELDDLFARAAADFPEGAGPVGLLSGDEFLSAAAHFDRALLARVGAHDGARAPGARVGLVLCADHRAAPHSARLATGHFAGIGAEVVAADLVHGDPRALEDCDVIYLAGGSPPALLACLAREPAWRRILDAWRGGAALAGSSAGAMALCEHSLTPEEGAAVPTRWEAGAGPVRGLGLAVHATTRARAWLESIAAAAPFPVVALDDHTGVVLARGRPHEVAGSGRVWIISNAQREMH